MPSQIKKRPVKTSNILVAISRSGMPILVGFIWGFFYAVFSAITVHPEAEASHHIMLFSIAVVGLIHGTWWGMRSGNSKKGTADARDFMSAILITIAGMVTGYLSIVVAAFLFVKSIP